MAAERARSIALLVLGLYTARSVLLAGSAADDYEDDYAQHRRGGHHRHAAGAPAAHRPDDQWPRVANVSDYCRAPDSLELCDNIRRCYGSKRAHANRIKGGTAGSADLFMPFVDLWNQSARVCGGAMIDRYHVLTSAQCVQTGFSEVRGFRPALDGAHPPDPAYAMGWIRAGTWCRAKDYDATDFGVTTIIKHDWAVAKFEQPQPHSQMPHVGCLPFRERAVFERDPSRSVLSFYQDLDQPINYTEHCYAMGRGWTKPRRPQSGGEFRYTRVEPVDCGLPYYGFDHWRGVCFQSVEAASGVCNFDMGGPVLCKYPANDNWFVVGILSSFSPSSCDGPFWVTHVANFVTNILEQCFP